MTESDDEIYKKAYADEQERIRIEGIKAKAQEDAKHASLGLSPRHKKSRVGRWLQKWEILIRGGNPGLVSMTRHDLQKSIDAFEKTLLQEREVLAKEIDQLERAFERAGLRVTRGGLYAGDRQRSDKERIKIYKPGVSIPTQDKIDCLELNIDDYKRELELRERLNTY